MRSRNVSCIHLSLHFKFLTRNLSPKAFSTFNVSLCALASVFKLICVFVRLNCLANVGLLFHCMVGKQTDLCAETKRNFRVSSICYLFPFFDPFLIFISIFCNTVVKGNNSVRAKNESRREAFCCNIFQEGHIPHFVTVSIGYVIVTVYNILIHHLRPFIFTNEPTSCLTLLIY